MEFFLTPIELGTNNIRHVLLGRAQLTTEADVRKYFGHSSLSRNKTMEYTAMATVI
jgi:hypothetical protein